MEESASAKLHHFYSKFQQLSFKKGETILRPDDEPRGIFYLKKGYTRLYSLSKNAQDITLVIFKPMDFFPLVWAINSSPNAYHLEAMTNVELYKIPRDEFLKFIKYNNDILFELTSHILTRFEGLLTRMEHALCGNALSKVASIVLICAERLGRKDKKQIIIDLPLTHQDLAKLIGVARETVSIEMKKLQNKGLIGYRGRHLIVKNVHKLRKESVLEADLSGIFPFNIRRRHITLSSV